MLHTFGNVDRYQARRRERDRRMKEMEDAARGVSSSVDDLLWEDSNIAPAVLSLDDEPEDFNEAPRRATRGGAVCRRLLANKLCVCIFLMAIVVATILGVTLTRKDERGFKVAESPSNRDFRYQHLENLILGWNVTDSTALKNASSPQGQALTWLATEDTQTAEPEVLRTRFALATLYFSTNNVRDNDGILHEWKSKSHWLSSYPVCLWHGIVCKEEEDTYQRVRLINITANELAGTIPDEIGLLEGDIKIMDLSFNSIEGTIPTTIEKLTQLVDLYLGPNYISGKIPDQIEKLSLLTHLYVNDCALTGTFPESLVSLQELQGLALYNNFLTGTVPNAIGEMKGLYVLYLDNNFLEGTIPQNIYRLTNLVDLRLRRNRFWGTIPLEMKALTDLHIMYLDNNVLSGTLPDELKDLRLLETIYLDHNEITGTISPALSNLFSSPAEDLYLFRNNLTGSVPSTFGHLSNLQQLRLQSNKLSGSLPSEMGVLDHLKSLYVSHNSIEGHIPPDYTALTKLERAHFHGNDIAGAMPDGFCSIVGLVELTADCKGEDAEISCKCCSACYTD